MHNEGFKWGHFATFHLPWGDMSAPMRRVRRTPDFEFDPATSEANLAKYGIDFVAGPAIWADGWAIEAPARTQGEERQLAVGRIGQMLGTAVATHRSEAVRIISVRRSGATAVRNYEDR